MGNYTSKICPTCPVCPPGPVGPPPIIPPSPAPTGGTGTGPKPGPTAVAYGYNDMSDMMNNMYFNMGDDGVPTLYQRPSCKLNQMLIYLLIFVIVLILIYLVTKNNRK